MVSAHDIETAIASLNAEQRKELMGEAVRDGNVLKMRFIASPARRASLARKGILVDRMYSEELTPLGEQVREKLLWDVFN